jgi:hypothetical protein
MKTYSIRASVRVDAQVQDRDEWAVNLVERSSLSEQLKAGWFWATWPDRVELVFPVRADAGSIQELSKEIELLLNGAAGVAGQVQLVVEERAK